MSERKIGEKEQKTGSTSKTKKRGQRSNKQKPQNE
jgi:hypothetical protein